jgi:hypothetical protein
VEEEEEEEEELIFLNGQKLKDQYLRKSVLLYTTSTLLHT